MAGGKGKGGSTPYEAPNTANSAQIIRVIDVISEGEIAGFAYGNEDSLKSVFLNNTPIQNKNGTYNFKRVTGYFQNGAPEQDYVPGFTETERVVQVGTEVKTGNPIVRTITDPRVTKVRVTCGVGRNVTIDDKQNVNPATTILNVSLVDDSGYTVRRGEIKFTEKSSDTYYRDLEIGLVSTSGRKLTFPVKLSVSRQTPDSDGKSLVNPTNFQSYTEVIEAKLTYTNTAFSALEFDSESFGGGIPSRNFLIKGKIVQVPSNYDPETRVYTGNWDGSFKMAWTNNPAWIFYDVATNKRYSSITRRLGKEFVDKWSLYAIAKYCDQTVQGEPRFVCNAYITNQRKISELLTDLASVFTGLPIWDGRFLSATVDAPTPPVALYNNSNVVGGQFNYSGAALKNIITAVQVSYADKTQQYQQTTEYVEDQEAVKRYGLNVRKIEAFGCDSRNQALRFARWILETGLRQQNSVSFVIGKEGLLHAPYDVIAVADNEYAGIQYSGRFKAQDAKGIPSWKKYVHLDREITIKERTLLNYYTQSGERTSLYIQHPIDKTGKKLPFDKPSEYFEIYTDVPIPVDAVWSVSGEVKTRLYRCTSITENTDDGTYTISALLHDPEKYKAVDGFKAEREVATVHTVENALQNMQAEFANRKLKISWDSLHAYTSKLKFEVSFYKDGVLQKQYETEKPELDVDGLGMGRYRFEIRAQDDKGQWSNTLVREFFVDYTIRNVRTEPLVLATKLDWQIPDVQAGALSTEVWVAKSPDEDAEMELLVTLPHPQSSYTLSGITPNEKYFFSLRTVDENGLAGDFTEPVRGQADPDPTAIVEHLTGAVGKSMLAEDMLKWLNDIESSKDLGEAALKQIEQEVEKAKNKVGAEVQQQVNELKAKAEQADTELKQVQTAISEQGKSIGQRVDDLSSKMARVSVGGRNYILKSKGEWGGYDAAGSIRNFDLALSELLKQKPTHLTLSADVEIEGNTSTTEGLGNRAGVRAFVVYTDGTREALEAYTAKASTKERLTATLEIPAGKNILSIGTVGLISRLKNAAKVKISNPKLETGNIATDWTPAIEDNDTEFNSIKSSVTRVEKTVTEQKLATAEQISGVTAQLGNVSSRVQTLSSAQTALNGKVNAMHSLKVETVTGGRKVVAGLTLGANGQTAESQMLVYADKFGLVNPNSKAVETPFVITQNGGRAKMALKGDFIADGLIQGKHIAAGQTIMSPEIVGSTGAFRLQKDGTINGAVIKGSKFESSNGNFRIDEFGNMYAKSGRFEGTVYAEKLEGDVMKMHRFERVSAGHYKLVVNSPMAKSFISILPFLVYSDENSEYGYSKVVVKLNGEVKLERQTVYPERLKHDAARKAIREEVIGGSTSNPEAVDPEATEPHPDDEEKYLLIDPRSDNPENYPFPKEFEHLKFTPPRTMEERIAFQVARVEFLRWGKRVVPSTPKSDPKELEADRRVREYDQRLRDTVPTKLVEQIYLPSYKSLSKGENSIELDLEVPMGQHTIEIFTHRSGEPTLSGSDNSWIQKLHAGELKYITRGQVSMLMSYAIERFNQIDPEKSTDFVPAEFNDNIPDPKVTEVLYPKDLIKLPWAWVSRA